MPKDIKDRKLAEVHSEDEPWDLFCFFPPAKKVGMLDLGTQIARCACASEKTCSLWGKTIFRVFFVPLEQQSL